MLIPRHASFLYAIKYFHERERSKIFFYRKQNWFSYVTIKWNVRVERAFYGILACPIYIFWIKFVLSLVCALSIGVAYQWTYTVILYISQVIYIIYYHICVFSLPFIIIYYSFCHWTVTNSQCVTTQNHRQFLEPRDNVPWRNPPVQYDEPGPLLALKSGDKTQL